MILIETDPALHPDYLLPRSCLREPIPELFWAAATIEEAVEEYLGGNNLRAASLLALCNTETVRNYIESLWGAAQRNPEQVHYLRKRRVLTLPQRNPRAEERMPSSAAKKIIMDRDGCRCRYCGVWVIPAEVRKKLNSLFPDSVPWGKKNTEQHSAFQALWLQFDHVLPASYGGESSIENIVVTCAGCNFAKFNYHIDELGLIDPRLRAPIPTRWNGLTHFLNRAAN